MKRISFLLVLACALSATGIAQGKIFSEIIEPTDAEPLRIETPADQYMIVENFVQEGGQRETRGLLAVFNSNGKASYVMGAGIIGQPTHPGRGREFFIAGPAVVQVNQVADAKLFLSYRLAENK